MPNLMTLPTLHLPSGKNICIVFKNGSTQASFSFIFYLFNQTSLQFLQQIYVKKCPSSIWCWDSNPQPSECESLPITTGHNTLTTHSRDTTKHMYCFFILILLKIENGPFPASFSLFSSS